jgi:hypothetical protein
VPSAPKPPRIARGMPDFANVRGGLAQLKSHAHRAYRDCRAAEPLPTSLIDRLWVDTLRATELAPPSASGKMYRRVEVLYRLLLDQHNWPRA